MINDVFLIDMFDLVVNLFDFLDIFELRLDFLSNILVFHYDLLIYRYLVEIF